MAILTAYWLDLGYLPYTPAFDIQEQVYRARVDDRLPSTIILQENPPTFTIGRAGSRTNLLVSAELLAEQGVEVLEVSRGGDITYHGPGQIIASPLFYLGDIDMNANVYLHSLEDVLIDVLALHGIDGGKDPDHPGVWIGPAKIGAVGIAVRHGFTFHGLSLNVSLDLKPFCYINPCGVPQMPVTSMAQLLGQALDFSEIKNQLKQAMAETFRLKLEDISWETLQSRHSLE